MTRDRWRGTMAGAPHFGARSVTLADAPLTSAGLLCVRNSSPEETRAATREQPWVCRDEGVI
jgi:hypothetical protein